jgi:diadenosine tetraphosphate (Ap4A) HIT family hydrolase
MHEDFSITTVDQEEKFNIEDWPWRDPIHENDSILIFKDRYPVTDTGHYLYVPKDNDMATVSQCLIAATQQGVMFVDQGTCDGFNIGMNYGEAAGQTIDWPHVHLILRKNGDCENPRGGVRNVIPGKGDYTSN